MCTWTDGRVSGRAEKQSGGRGMRMMQDDNRRCIIEGRSIIRQGECMGIYGDIWE